MKIIILSLFISLQIFAQSTLLTLVSDDAFSPLTSVKSATLNMWYDTSVPSSITSSSNLVSQWNDLSGNGRHLKQTGVQKPDLTAEGILFNSDYMVTDAIASPIAQPLTYFYVLQIKTWTLDTYIMDGFGASNRQVMSMGATTPKVKIYGGAGFVAQGDDASTVAAYGIITAQYNGASSFVQTNNGTRGTGNAGTQTSNGLYLGISRSLSANGHFSVKEILVYSGTISEADITAIKNYLAKKWSLTL